MSEFNNKARETWLSLGLLFLRVSVGGLMLAAHGWGKLMNYSTLKDTFPDPLGVGSPISLAMVIGAEAFCSIAVILGLATRLVVIPLAITMLVAIIVIHADDPWEKKEFAMMYLIPFLTLLMTGAGKYSIDAMCCKRK
jgi:putative oxidoreductase